MSQLCRKCGTLLNAVEENQSYHPMCTPDFEKLPGSPMTLGEMVIKEELMEIIDWANAESPRTQQRALGCSEVGTACDRRIAYRIAGTKRVNFPDTLKANMGTAFHTYLDNAVTGFQHARNTTRYFTEIEVWPADFVKGHVDLYDIVRQIVLDWKTTSAENLRLWKKTGIPFHYLVQIMLYGKGVINAGRPVQRVGLVGISRSGTYRDVAVLTVPYDDKIANDALRRVWQIGKAVTVEKLKFHEFTTDTEMCGWCPFFRGGTRSADATGCPGKINQTDDVSGLFT